MRTYTRDELVIAMMQYNQKALTEPGNFDPINNTKEGAESQVDFLLGLVDQKEPV